MIRPFRYFFFFVALLLFNFTVIGQVDDFCAESGFTPSLDSPFARVPYVYGRITLKGFDPSKKLPNVTISFADRQQPISRFTISKTGNYCFKTSGGGGGTLIIEINGIEATRRSLPSLGATQQREDFEIFATDTQKSTTPGVVSAKFFHPENPKTIELYKKTVKAEGNKESQKAIEYLKEIVVIDPADFIAWAKLGFLYMEKNSLPEAEAAFRKSLELKVEYTPVWINVGLIRVAQKNFAAAIEIFKHAAELEPTSARIFQLLGESYLQTRQGTLGAQALNEAIRLDPVGMADCHLQLAHLYQLAGAKNLAAREYRIFLTKVPDHPDKKKFEKFIKDNPE